MTTVEDLEVKAVIVGINEYIDSSSLKYCVKDATDFRNFLLNPQYGTRDPENVLLLTDGSDPDSTPLKSNIMASLELVTGISQPSDAIIFYFAGHGDDINGEPALIPADYRSSRGIDSAIKIEEVKQILNRAKASFKLLLLDSCHSGATKGRAESGKMGRATYQAIQEIPLGFSVISACSIDQLSYEDDEFEHGIFTYYLLNGVEGDADGNDDGKITINEIYEYVTPLVRTRAFQKHRAVQTPFFETKIAGIYTLSNIDVEENGAETDSELVLFKMIKLSHVRTASLERNINDILLVLRKLYGIAYLHDNGNMITFPDGVVNRLSDRDSDIRFDYSNNKKNGINDALSLLDNMGIIRTNWTYIEFLSPYLLDMLKIEKVCDKNNYTITDIKLTEPKSITFVTDYFRAKNLDSSKWLFQNYKVRVIIHDENSIIRFEEPNDDTLAKDFYNVLNLDTVTKFIKPLLSD